MGRGNHPFYLSQSEYCPETFVINNLPLVDAGQLIKCLALKAPVPIVEGEGAIGIIQYFNFFTGKTAIFFCWVHEIKDLIVLECQ